MIFETVPTKKEKRRFILQHLGDATNEQIHRIKDLYKQGYNVIDISRALRLPVSTVQYHAGLLDGYFSQ